MEEKIIPPDEKEWKEDESFLQSGYLGSILILQTRGYLREDKPESGLVTMGFLDDGVVLKIFGSGPRGKMEQISYLQLSDGRWVKGLSNVQCDVVWESEVRPDGKFLKVTISVNTKYGLRRRIIRKKMEEKK